jgi:hypothetical protein
MKNQKRPKGQKTNQMIITHYRWRLAHLNTSVTETHGIIEIEVDCSFCYNRWKKNSQCI